VEAVDTLSGLCAWEEITRRIASGWLRYVMLPVEAPGWRFDDSQQLWVGPC
jgi:hypothetical protein